MPHSSTPSARTCGRASNCTNSTARSTIRRSPRPPPPGCWSSWRVPGAGLAPAESRTHGATGTFQREGPEARTVTNGMTHTRSTVLERLRRKMAARIPLVGAGAGTGISGKCAQAGGADLIVIYNSGRFRMAGHGSLSGLTPYGGANAVVMEMACEVLPVVRDVPVLAGVCGTDPFR